MFNCYPQSTIVHPHLLTNVYITVINVQDVHIRCTDRLQYQITNVSAPQVKWMIHLTSRNVKTQRCMATFLLAKFFLTPPLLIFLVCLPPCWLFCCPQTQLQRFKQPGVRLSSEGWLLCTFIFFGTCVLTGPRVQGSPVTHGGIVTPHYSSLGRPVTTLYCHGNSKTESLSWCGENYT